MVLDIEPLGPSNSRHALAEVQLARMSDFGRNDTVFYSRTHLGNVLHTGGEAGWKLGLTLGFVPVMAEKAAAF